MDSIPSGFIVVNPHAESWWWKRGCQGKKSPVWPQGTIYSFSSDPLPQHSRWPARHTELLSPGLSPWDGLKGWGPPWWVTKGKSRKFSFERMANTSVCSITLSVISVPVPLSRLIRFQVQVIIRPEVDFYMAISTSLITERKKWDAKMALWAGLGD